MSHKAINLLIPKASSMWHENLKGPLYERRRAKLAKNLGACPYNRDLSTDIIFNQIHGKKPFGKTNKREQRWARMAGREDKKGSRGREQRKMKNR
jgi:hypothetical protein